MTGDETRDIARSHRRLRPQWSKVIRSRVVLIGLLIVVAVSLGTIAWHQFSSHASSETNRADQATVSAEQLCEQVRSLGAICVVDPSTLPKGPPGDTGATGAAGAPGGTGQTGRTGARGATGRGVASIICIDTEWRVQYTDGVIDNSAGKCTGPAGVNGVNGTNGTDGAAGAAGPAGPAGAPGADGKDGVDGKPPASWTYTNALGQMFQCTRDPGSPDTAATYSCNPVMPGSGTSPDPNGRG